jgi:hypothetical protein
MEGMMTEMAEIAKKASALEGKNTPVFPYYVPLQTASLNMNSLADIIQESEKFKSPDGVYVPKSGNLIERTSVKGGRPLTFDIFEAYKDSYRNNLRSFHLRPVVKQVGATLDMIKKTDGLSYEERSFYESIDDALSEVLERVFINTYFEGSIYNKTLNTLKQMGYMADLASVPRAVNELQSNLTHAMIANPQSFMSGLKYVAENFSNKEGGLDKDKMIEVFNNLGLTQTVRLTQKGASMRTDITEFDSSKGKHVGAIGWWRKLSSNVNEKLIEMPDTAVAYPVTIGAFMNEYTKITGKKPKMSDFLDNNFLIDNKDAISKASQKANVVLSQGYASFNMFESTLVASAKKNANMIEMFSKYMIRFQVTEANTMLKAFDGVMGKNELSKREASALALATIARMTSYTYFAPISKALFLTSIAKGASMLGVGFGLGEEEEYPVMLDKERAMRSVTSSIVQMAMLRRLNSLQSLPLKFGIEKANKEYLGFMREADYNPYTESLVFNSIRISEKGVDANFTDFLGAYSKIASSSIDFGKTLYPILSDEKMSRKKEEQLNKRLIANSAELFATTVGFPAARDFIQMAKFEAFKEYRAKRNKNNKKGFDIRKSSLDKIDRGRFNIDDSTRKEMDRIRKEAKERAEEIRRSRGN